MQSHPASYKDTDGYIFWQDGLIYRYIQPAFETHYSRFMQSGLYDELIKKDKLVKHVEVSEIEKFGFWNGRVILPEQISFISYPYEWSFNMWKDAALLTLDIALKSLEHGMLLKDATPFNVQFHKGLPLFIDTLSFENYTAGEPWIAYRQFCESFLAPLLLMHYCHPDMGKIFSVYPNGMPMNVLSALLPGKTRFNLNVILHVFLQASLSGKSRKKNASPNNFSKQKLITLVKGLESFVKKLQLKKVKTTWDNYYTGTILGDDYLQAKSALVKSFITEIEYKNVIDLGANDGYFSLLFDENKQVIALDADPNCMNELYLKNKKSGKKNLLPLVMQITAPSPSIGWNNTERESITDRLQADLVLSLALVHHLAIAANVPLKMIADWLQPMGKYLIIEFVPKTDEKVKLLLQNREDVFVDYHLDEFKNCFSRHFEILKEQLVGNTQRVLFLMKRKV